METNRLKYFCTVVNTGSIVKAAELLHLSHSGLSKAISVLQEELKVELIRPLGRGIEITDTGYLVYERSLKVLAALANLENFDIHAELGLIRIGLSEILTLAVSSNLISEYDAPVRIETYEIGGLEKKINDGEIDFGFAFASSPNKEIEYLEMGKIKFHAYAHRALVKQYPDTSIPFVVPSSEYPQNPLGLKERDGWPGNNKRNSYYQCSHFSIAIDLFNNAKAAAFLPDFIVSNLSHAIKLESFATISNYRVLYLVKSKKQSEDKIIKKACKVIRKICF